MKKIYAEWNPPSLIDNIKSGDMPEDKVAVYENHIQKANVIFPQLLKLIDEKFEENKKNNRQDKIVITICGGSGVGKTGVASLITYYLNKMEIQSYTLSGDNYPHRIPKYNDAERLRVFREHGIRGMVKDEVFSKERFDIVRTYQVNNDDANPEIIKDYEWYKSYIDNGKNGLASYLGSSNELDFVQLEEVINSFKNGDEHIWLKRMGREDSDLWYDKIYFADTKVLIIEWTHGNSDNYKGVDIPILLNSTPQETLEHRKSRNRDNAIDSPFTTMVLELEQEMIKNQAHKAKIIVSNSCELLTYAQYCNIMN